MSLIKQKQVENLLIDLLGKANDSQVLKIANNLADLGDNQQARDNLSLLTEAEINALVVGVQQARSVADIAERDALTDLNITDRIFVSDDGDGKWAMYIVTAITDGLGSTSTYEKIANRDLFDNAMTATAIKTAYESNADTNAFTDAEKTKSGHISVTQPVDLDAMESDIANNTTAIVSKMDEFSVIEESFTGMNIEEGQDNVITLSNIIAASHAVTVFFEGVKVSNVTYTNGTNQITVNVPYTTESLDTIYVKYAR